MAVFAFIVHVRNKIVCTGTECVTLNLTRTLSIEPLSMHNLKLNNIELLISDDTRISPYSETSITAKIVEPGGLGARLAEHLNSMKKFKLQNVCLMERVESFSLLVAKLNRNKVTLKKKTYNWEMSSSYNNC